MENNMNSNLGKKWLYYCFNLGQPEKTPNRILSILKVLDGDWKTDKPIPDGYWWQDNNLMMDGDFWSLVNRLRDGGWKCQ